MDSSSIDSSSHSISSAEVDLDYESSPDSEPESGNAPEVHPLCVNQWLLTEIIKEKVILNKKFLQDF